MGGLTTVTAWLKDTEPSATADTPDTQYTLDTLDTLDLEDTPDMVTDTLEVWDIPDSAAITSTRDLPTLTPTPSARSLTAFPRPTPTPPAIPTTPDMLPASATATMEDTESMEDMPDMGSGMPDMELDTLDTDMLDMDMLVLWDTDLESKSTTNALMRMFECDICHSLI